MTLLFPTLHRCSRYFYRCLSESAGVVIGVGMTVVTSPLPPNRTGGFPASGFPVDGSSLGKRSVSSTVPKDAVQTSGASQTRLSPPPASPRGHSRWFVVHISDRHLSTFLRSLRSPGVTPFHRY